MIFGMNQELVDRLARVLRWFESRPADGDTSEPRVPNWQHIKVTGPAVEGGDPSLTYYPGVVVGWDAPGEVEVEYGNVWIFERNGATLSEDVVYSAQQSGDLELDDPLESRTVFAVASGAAGGVTVRFIKCVQWIEE